MISMMKCMAMAAFGLVFFSLNLNAQSVTIRFDNNGEEAGVTTTGTSEFEFMGSSWSGGVINTAGVPALYASGSFSYEVPNPPAMVVFSRPATDVEFFFVHGAGFAAGTATALDADGNALGSVNSNQATSFGDPGNFVAFDTSEPISAIDFSGGVIDNFSYTLTDEFMADFRLFEGNWVIEDADGEGLMFDFVEFADLLFVAWFTHTTMPMMPSEEPPDDVGALDNRWVTAQLDVSGNAATGPIFVTTGGRFDSPETEFQETPEVGEMTIEFTACNAATVTYEIFEPPLGRQFSIIPLEEALGGSQPACETSDDENGSNGSS